MRSAAGKGCLATTTGRPAFMMPALASAMLSRVPPEQEGGEGTGRSVDFNGRSVDFNYLTACGTQNRVRYPAAMSDNTAPCGD
jgi:hypothetical protein